MSDQNELIGVNLICILVIIFSIYAVLGISIQLINWDIVKTYFTAYYGSEYAESSKLLLPVWLVLSFAYLVVAVMALCKKEIGRKLFILMAIVFLIVTFAVNILQYCRGTLYNQYLKIIGSSIPGFHILLSSTIIYIFTRPTVKEQFK